MKTFLEYITIRENSSINNKPIIFASNQGVIIPSEHGGNPDGSSSNTGLGKLAYQVESKRRKEIYDLAKQKGGIFFLGSDHLPAMAIEIGA